MARKVHGWPRLLAKEHISSYDSVLKRSLAIESITGAPASPHEQPSSKAVGKMLSARATGGSYHASSPAHLCCSRNQLPFVLVSLLLFSVLCGAGIALSKVYDESSQKELYYEVTELAIETGDFFSKELDRAILPLFSMAQFATELDIFKGLPDTVGPANEQGSIPFQINEDGSPSYKRNVTGVCDQPKLLERFDQIASTIKANSKMDGVLHNIQLAPEGVICLLHPLINTEDFEDGSVLDNRGALGIDLLSDPFHKFIARASLKQEDVGIAGPRFLTQCPECGLYFIARLPIPTSKHKIVVDDEPYDRWGFATALINWDRLIERSGVHEHFLERGFEFQLTRTDQNFNETTDSYDEEVVVISQSEIFGTKERVVSTALQTTNNEWILTIQYNDVHRWHATLVTVTVVLALCISVLVYVILSQKQTMVGTTMAQEAKVEMERSMTAYFAHELRNPLSGIDSALLAMPETLPADMADLVAGMRLCSTFMNSIMANLLDVRKIEEGKMVLREEPLSLKRLVNDVHKILLPTVREAVELRVEASANECDWVLGDLHRLQQVISNITSNAIKNTVCGSVKMLVQWVDGSVQFECQDTGPGIPKGEQEQLFERFIPRGGAPGSELGLAIAKKLVDLMGGTIRFDSNPTLRPGTICIVTLPLKRYNEEPEKYLTKPKDSTEPIELPLSILLVDDIQVNRSMLKRRILRGVAPNCTIYEAATGEQALAMCEAKEFDVIIMDQYMETAGGVMVGTDAIIALRRMKLDSILIIGCSGNDLDDEFRAAGADLVWKKPMPPNSEILRQLRRELLSNTKAYL